MRSVPALLLAFLSFVSCAEQGPPPAEVLSEALTFHAGFEDGMDGAFARGDRRIYSAPSYNELERRSPGYWGMDIEIAYDAGRFGHALRFNRKNEKALFYSAGEGNVAFSPDGWSGTVSFWLSVDPENELAPGFCDPIQITDSAYNDSAIWVDFTRETPRQFRLGAFGELSAWNPDNKPNNENPGFNDRLVVVGQPPFASGKWTHIVIVHDGLGTADGRAALYLDGQLQGTSEGISEPFEWDEATASIRLGVNYVGLFDDLALFSSALTGEQVASLYDLEGGAASLR